jgi:hypothetical protein
MSRLTKMNDTIRAHARAVANREALSYNEQIVAAVEEELGWTLSESEGKIAVTAYAQRRNEVLAQQTGSA